MYNTCSCVCGAALTSRLTGACSCSICRFGNDIQWALREIRTMLEGAAAANDTSVLAKEE
jgi:hypothetical protein